MTVVAYKGVMSEDVFTVAKLVFGKDVYVKWTTIMRQAEWLWWNVLNVKYGPLNHRQRGYAVSLIQRALMQAKDGDKPLGLYMHIVRQYANHEDVDRKMKELRDVEELAGAGELLG